MPRQHVHPPPPPPHPPPKTNQPFPPPLCATALVSPYMAFFAPEYKYDWLDEFIADVRSMGGIEEENEDRGSDERA